MVTRKTRRIVTRAALWGVIVLLSVGTVYLSLSTWRVYTRMVEVEGLREVAESERNALEARNNELKASLQALETPRGVEAEVRTRYPLVRPGEIEFVLGESVSSTVDTSEEPRDSIWAALMGWLK